MAEGRKGAERILMAVFRVDRLALSEWHFDLQVVDGDLLGASAHEIHLNSASLVAVNGAMTKRVCVEVSIQLAIDSRQQVQIELSRDVL